MRGGERGWFKVKREGRVERREGRERWLREEKNKDREGRAPL